MKIKPDTNCPLNGFKRCKGLNCAWFTQIRGSDPNTEAELNDWRYAMSWMAILLIENAQQSRQTGAAVESFRNEINKAQQQIEHSKLRKIEKISNPN